MEGPGAVLADDVVGRDLVGEEGVVEAADAASVQEEGRVAAEVEAAADGLAGDGGQEGEVCGAGDVGGGDGGDVDFKVDGARVELGVVREDGAVAEGVVGGEDAGVERGEVVGDGDQVPADAGDVGEGVDAWEGHGAAPAFEGTGGHHLRVLPVGSPRDGDGRLVFGGAVEELAGIVVFAEVGDASDAVDGREGGAVEVAGEVLGYAAAEGRAGVDADDEEVHVLLGGAFHGDGDQIGAFVLQAEEAVVREVGGVGPVFEVGGGVDADDKLLGERHDHDPGFSGRVPDDFGVAELRAVDRNDGVAGVLGESVAAVGGVGNILRFLFGRVERVDGNYTVGLVGEEAGGVVDVDDGTAGEDAFVLCAWKYGNRLIDPVVEVFGGRVTPVLVAGDDIGRIVCDTGEG